MTTVTKQITVLMLTANPENLDSISVNREYRTIDNVLSSSTTELQLSTELVLDTQYQDLQQRFLAYRPCIVHFSGHGTRSGMIMLLDDEGHSRPVSAAALKNLFMNHADYIQCVVLNACYSEIQAQGIAENINCVIGMKQEIGDMACLNFSRAFYQSLVSGRTYRQAFREACNEIELAGLSDSELPQLHLTTDCAIDGTNHEESQSDIVGSVSALVAAGQLEEPFGTMHPRSPFYIERRADRRVNPLLDSICGGRAITAYIQAPRQCGKSSLIQRMLHALRVSSAVRIAYVDFELFTDDQLMNIDDFLISLCCMITDELDLSDRIDDFWASRRRSPLIKCANYFTKYILPEIAPAHLVLAMDEVERVLGETYQDDFFGMLRTWHNGRSHNSQLAHMSLVLSSSTEPQLFIENPNQSPFNVATPILLQDFDSENVYVLNQRHGDPVTSSQLASLMDLLGGHPFLTRVALYQIAVQNYSFAELMDQATSDDGPFGFHLTHYWHRLSHLPELLEPLRLICSGQNYPPDKQYYRLKGAGLVGRSTQATMRNELYRKYFSERLNELCG